MDICLHLLLLHRITNSGVRNSWVYEMDPGEVRILEGRGIGGHVIFCQVQRALITFFRQSDLEISCNSEGKQGPTLLLRYMLKIRTPINSNNLNGT